MKCDNRIRERNNEKNDFIVETYPYLQGASHPGVVPMEIDLAKQERLRENGKPRNNRESERRRRFQLNLCLYCGAPGHQVRSCPKKPPAALNNKARLH